MTAEPRKEYVQRFSDAINAANEHGNVRAADPILRVFQFGPVTLNRVSWVSDREELNAVSRVERDDGEFMTVMVT